MFWLLGACFFFLGFFFLPGCDRCFQPSQILTVRFGKQSSKSCKWTRDPKWFIYKMGGLFSSLYIIIILYLRCFLEGYWATLKKCKTTKAVGSIVPIPCLNLCEKRQLRRRSWRLTFIRDQPRSLTRTSNHFHIPSSRLLYKLILCPAVRSWMLLGCWRKEGESCTSAKQHCTRGAQLIVSNRVVQRVSFLFDV